MTPMTWISKSIAISAACMALISGPLSLDVSAQDTHRHALSLVGEPKFGPDFKHFDWVNPDAPKGGTVRRASLGSFDTLNPFSIKGEAADGVAGFVYDTLMAPSLDEPSTEYGLIAEWVSHPEDYSSATFKLREGARFHDGQPITPEDVIFSLEALKAANPLFALYYKNVTSAEKTGDHEVTFRFDMKGNRELPQILGQLYVLPKHFWEGKQANGQPRDITKSTLEVPLGSGPYRIKSVDAGRQVAFERVDDYWAKDLPVARGLYNFDEIRYIYFRDRVPAFEAFKAGQIDLWTESSANAWATQYNIGAVKDGQIKKEALPHKRVAPMQAFAFNLRRPQFQDPRVRQAFNLAFNFEALNKSLFYEMYVRVGSYFDNSELKATGLPQGRELELLEKVRDKVPPEVFTKEWKMPVSADATAHRNNLRAASKLLQEAGWQRNGRVLTNAKGETLSVEFLIVSPDFERVLLPYIDDLKKLGIEARVRLVDSTQYTRRLEEFDFDIVVGSFSQSHSPGNEQREYWGSAAADKNGSRNIIGIKNPAVDELIEDLVQAKDREEVVAATRAIDRVLLWNYYVVPQWHYPFDRVAFWDIFGRPDVLPSQSPAATTNWWVDADKAKALASQRGM